MFFLTKLKYFFGKMFYRKDNDWDKYVDKTNLCRTVVENIGVGVSVIAPDMRILAANKRMHDWFPNVDFSKKPHCFKVYNDPPRSEICTYCPVVKSMLDGLVHESVTSTPSKNGIVNFRVVSSAVKDSLGRVVCAIEMVEDVTASFESEKIRTLLSTIVENSDEAIISKTLDGKILSWNRGAEKTYGYWASEMIGKNISLIIPENKQTEFEKILQKIRFGESVSNFETQRVRKDGAITHVLLSISPLRDKVGKIYGASTIARDITKMKVVEESLRSKLEDLERMHQLTVGREKRIIELKEEIRSLKEKQASTEQPK